MTGRLKSVFSLIGPPTLYFSYAYTLFFKHFYHLMLLNSCIAPLFFIFFACWWRVFFSLQRCRLQGGEEFSLPVVHSHFFNVHWKNLTMALLWFSSIYLLCLSSTLYLLEREKAELCALPRVLPPSPLESISAVSIPKRCLSSNYPSAAAAVFPPFYVAIASHTYHRYGSQVADTPVKDAKHVTELHHLAVTDSSSSYKSTSSKQEGVTHSF